MPGHRPRRPLHRLLTTALVAVLTLTGLTTAAAAADATGAIVGHVTVPDGVSPAETRAAASSTSTGIYTWVDVQADGSYAIDGLAVGSYRVQVVGFGDTDLVPYHHGGTDSWSAQPVDVTDGGTTVVDASLGRAGRITGTVVDAAGAPVESASVQLVSATGSYLSLAGWADSTGAYAVRHVPAGTYRVNVLPPYGSTLVGTWYGGASQSTATPVTVEAGGDVALGTTTLSQAGFLTGRAVSQGAPLAGAYVNVQPAEPGGAGASGWTEADGTFRVAVGTGRYLVSVQAPAGSVARTTYWPGTQDIAQAGRADVTAGGTTALGDIDLPTGASLSGTVTAPDGSPVANVSVSVQTFAPGGPWGFGHAVTAADGTYTVGGLGAGDYRVTFTPPSGTLLRTEYYDDARRWDRATAVPVGNGPVTGIDAELDASVCVTGTLRTEDGSALPGHSLLLFPTPSSPEASYPSAVSGPDGRFRLTDASAGDYLLQFSSWGSDLVTGFHPGGVGADEAEVLTLAGGTCLDLGDVTVPKGGVVTGRVLDPAGAPVSSASVSVSGTAGGGWATTGDDGTYRVAGLSAGEYVVRLAGGGGDLAPVYYPGALVRSEAQEIPVALREEVALDDVRLPRAATLRGEVVRPDGTPAQEVMLLAEGPETYVDGPAPGRSGADGRFEVTGVVPAPTVLAAWADPAPGAYLGVRTYYDGDDGTQRRSEAVPIPTTSGGVVDGLRLVMPPRGDQAADVAATLTPERPVLGRRVTVDVTVAGAAGVPTGVVEVAADRHLGDATLDADGHARVTFVVPDANYTVMGPDPVVSVVYTGDATYDEQRIDLPFDVETPTDPEPVTPTVTAVSPASGSVVGGTPVTVTGTGFAAGAAVTFGGVPATDVVVESATSLRAVAPAHPAGEVPVVVTTDGGTSEATTSFRYEQVATSLTLTSSAASVTAGSPVTFTATAASPAGAPAGSVTFTVGSQPAQQVPLVDGVARLTVPSLTAGTHTVGAVFTGDATFLPSSATLQQVVTAAAARPVLVGALPPVACTAGGTTVLLIGRHLTGTTSVTFGSTAAAKVRVVSDTTLSVRVPAHAAGKTDVRVVTAGGTSKAVPFVYVAPPRGFTCPKVAPVS